MKYLTKEEVAEILRVSVRTVTDYMSKGLLPVPKRLGRRLLWDEQELLRTVDGAMRNSRFLLPLATTAKRGRPRKLRCIPIAFTE